MTVDTRDLHDDVAGLTDRQVMAGTLWGEARGEGITGMIAVANVIMNRARKPGWWGSTPREVCLKNRQFSCWNAGDPNRDKILSVPIEDKNYQEALRIAGEALEGQLPDYTNGATHYHTKQIKPYWAKAEKPIAEIGNHLFYKDA